MRYDQCPWGVECCPPEWNIVSGGTVIAELGMEMYPTRYMEAVWEVLWPDLFDPDEGGDVWGQGLGWG